MQKLLKIKNGFWGVKILPFTLVIVIGVFIFMNPKKDIIQEPSIKVFKQDTFMLSDSSGYGKKITVSGILKPVNSATVISKIPGDIIRFPFNAGDTVKKGDIIAEIEHGLLNAELDTARSELNRIYADSKKQLLVSKSNLSKSKISVDKINTAIASNEKIKGNNVVYAYKNAYDSLHKSFSDAVISISFLSDNVSIWRGSVNSEEMSNAVDSLIKSSNILFGADSKSAQWSSNYLIELKGGVSGKLSAINKERIDELSIDDVLNKTALALFSIKKGLESIKTIKMLRDPESGLSVIDNEIKRVNNAISRITQTQKDISSAQISKEVSRKKQEVDKLGALQILKDSKNNYEANELSANRMIEAAKKRISYIETKIEDAFVRAPFDGVITDKFVSLGDSISTGSKIAHIASLNKWKAVFSAPDMFNEFIKVGAMVKINIKGVDEGIEVPISRVIPDVQLRSKRIRFEVDVAGISDMVKNGMVVDGIVVSDGKNITQSGFFIPNKFVGYDYDGAYVVTNNNERIPVAIYSRQKDGSFIVSSSLKDGIILKNPLLLKNA